MDVFSLLELLNNLGFPLPLCIVLVALVIWLLRTHQHVNEIEDQTHDFATKQQLNQYIRRDIFKLRIDSINTEYKISESLNAIRIDHLDKQVEQVEARITKLEQLVRKICRWIKRTK